MGVVGVEMRVDGGEVRAHPRFDILNLNYNIGMSVTIFELVALRTIVRMFSLISFWMFACL